MCYICKCCGWALDFVQRVLTFALACIMCIAICTGVTVAIVAGIAYGYNYMLAEFLTLGRTDVSVYVRRGQFYDKPNFGKFRRKGDEDDLFASNSSDYQDTKIQSDSKPLSDTWRKALNTRKYAEKLTKYSHGQFGADNFNNRSVATPADEADTTTDNKLTVIRRVFSVTPNPGMPTTIHPARTDIVMRNFAPVDKMPMSPNSINLDDEFYQDHARSTVEPKRKHHKEKIPDIKINLKDKKRKSYVPIKDLSKSKLHIEYPTEDVDEDNIVYRPV